MSNMINSTSLTLLALATSGIGLAAMGCEQPAPNCTAGRGAWTMVYTPKPGAAAACADTTVDVYGIQVYSAAKADGTPDLKASSVAIQNDYEGSVAQNAVDWGYPPDPDQKWYAFGAFANAEPQDNFCNIPNMAPAKVDVPEVPAIEDDPTTPDVDESYPGAPAMSFQYDWSNVAFYVKPSLLGTVMRGDVKVTIDGLACEYHAIGVYPNMYCGTTIMQDFPDPNDPSKALGCGADPTACDDFGATCVGIVCKAPVKCTDSTECTQYEAVCNGGVCEKADQHLCSPYPDPDNGYPEGSGISPDIPMKCDEATMTCVPDGTPPQLQ